MWLDSGESGARVKHECGPIQPLSRSSIGVVDNDVHMGVSGDAEG